MRKRWIYTHSSNPHIQFKIWYY